MSAAVHDPDYGLVYIRQTYGVPAFVGRRVTVYTGETGEILSGDGQYISVRVDGFERPWRLHPTWKVEYHEARPLA